jgi:zinc/manganese transport system ATP-binding protein
MSARDALVLDAVTIRYGAAVAVNAVSGRFAEGSLTAVAGPNGAGKSTLLKAIAGILPIAAGRIVKPAAIARATAYLPQSSALPRDYPLTVRQTAALGLWPHLGNRRAITAAERAKVETALTHVGLEALADRQIEALSGGQFQRLLFARALLQDARLILLDEPFTGVDAETTAKLIQLLLQWHKEGRTIVCVLHDLLLIRKYFPESFVLAGKCLGKGHTHALFEQKLLSFDLDSAELLGPDDPEGHDHA